MNKLSSYFLLSVLAITINLYDCQGVEDGDEYEDVEEVTTVGTSCSLGVFKVKALQCIKDFDKMIPGKSEMAKCCVYNQLYQCSTDTASDVCSNSSIITHLEKQRKTVRISKCSNDVDYKSWNCFWLVWESVITFGCVLIIIAIMMLVCTLHFNKWNPVHRYFWNKCRMLKKSLKNSITHLIDCENKSLECVGMEGGKEWTWGHCHVTFNWISCFIKDSAGGINIRHFLVTNVKLFHHSQHGLQATCEMNIKIRV